MPEITVYNTGLSWAEIGELMSNGFPATTYAMLATTDEFFDGLDPSTLTEATGTGYSRITLTRPTPIEHPNDVVELLFDTIVWDTGAATDWPASVRAIYLVTTADNSGNTVCSFHFDDAVDMSTAGYELRIRLSFVLSKNTNGVPASVFNRVLAGQSAFPATLYAHLIADEPMSGTGYAPQTVTKTMHSPATNQMFATIDGFTFDTGAATDWTPALYLQISDNTDPDAGTSYARVPIRRYFPVAAYFDEANTTYTPTLNFYLASY